MRFVRKTKLSKGKLLWKSACSCTKVCLLFDSVLSYAMGRDLCWLSISDLTVQSKNYHEWGHHWWVQGHCCSFYVSHSSYCDWWLFHHLSVLWFYLRLHFNAFVQKKSCGACHSCHTLSLLLASGSQIWPGHARHMIQPLFAGCICHHSVGLKVLIWAWMPPAHQSLPPTLRNNYCLNIRKSGLMERMVVNRDTRVNKRWTRTDVVTLISVQKEAYRRSQLKVLKIKHKFLGFFLI